MVIGVVCEYGITNAWKFAAIVSQSMKLLRPIARLFSTISAKPTSIESIRELHARLITANLHRDPRSISPVIRAYALSPPNLEKARLAFDQVEGPTLPLWNYLVRGLSLSAQPNEAIRLYSYIYSRGFVGDNLTFIFVLKACARVSDVLLGKKVHALALKLGFVRYLFVANALIHMYGFCGVLCLARKVFDEMMERDLVSWNSLICGYTKWNEFKEVLDLFETMRETGVRADSVTMMKVILACSYLGKYENADMLVKYIEANNIAVNAYLGNTIIDMYARRGLVNLARGVFFLMRDRNVVSWNAMIVAYAKAGHLLGARALFDQMPERDVVSWTAMMTAYSQANQHSDAVKLFQEMMASKVKPDEVTVTTVLSACAHLGSLEVGEAIHDLIINGGVKADVDVGNALIDMYCKCGVGEKALKVFHMMEIKDSISWTSVISGLAVNGFANPALELFSQMLREGIRPTHGTFVGVLLACAHTGLVDKGLEYFESMEKVHGFKPEMKHYGCLVDILSRSGNLEKAYRFIKSMPVIPDVVIWRILLNACKLYGNVTLAEVVTKKLLELDPHNSGNYVLSSSTYAGTDRWDEAVKMRELMQLSNVPKPFGYSSIELDGLASSDAQNSHFGEEREKSI